MDNTCTFAILHEGIIVALAQHKTDEAAREWHRAYSRRGDRNLILVALDLAEDEEPCVGDIADVDENGIAVLVRR
jgi:hypothetical protein